MEGVSNARCRVFEAEADSGHIYDGPKQSRSLRNKYSSVNADRSDNRGFDWIAAMGDTGARSARQPHFERCRCRQFLCGYGGEQQEEHTGQNAKLMEGCSSNDLR